MQHLTQAIHDKLTAHAPLVAAVANRIHLGSAADDAPLPHIVFTVTRNQPRLTFSKAHLGVEVVIDIVSNVDAGAHAAVAISDSVFTALHETTLTIVGHTASGATCLERGQLTRDGDAYHVRSRYRVWGTAR